ncbi:MAG: SMP-30/gluconolactonase/LRE family protein [SAR202 cluster bacterium]|nr:SMP-30/gluconolactonase/LRE family protein [SAR202 cluster bacterium]
MKRPLILISALVALVLLIAACGGDTTPEPAESAAMEVVVTPTPLPAAGAREVTILAGGGEDTVLLNAFLARDITVRAGDTVTWNLGHPDEVHTVSFLSGGARIPDVIPVEGGAPTDLQLNPAVAFPTRFPGTPVESYDGTGIINSGMMSNAPGGPDAPPNNVMSVVMTTEGTYDYVCLLHPQMIGTVTVVADNAANVESQAEIDARAGAEEAALRAQIDGVRAAGAMIRSEAGPNGTTTWHVQVGPAGFDSQLELYEFLASDLTIQEGDSVVFSSAAPSIHTVTFHPGQPQPEFVIPDFSQPGPPVLKANPLGAFPVKPSGEFDGTGYWNSGIMSAVGGPGGTAFTMTFSKAGSYDYICAIHQTLGMEANITVVERTTSVVSQLNGISAQFPEGLALAANGNLLVGIAPTGEIREYTASGTSTSYAKLPAPGAGFLLDMVFDADGNLYAAMSSFDEATHGVWRVPAGGGDGELFASLPVEGFPNALVFDANGDLFVTDSIGGGVWKIDQQGEVSTWASDPLLVGTLPPGPLGFPIGANGIVFDAAQQNVYVANTDKARIVQIPVNADGTAGTAVTFVEDTVKLGGPDGMTFGADGYIYVAVVGSDAVAKISPDGEITVLAQGGPLQNPSDVQFGSGDDSGTLYVANFAVFRLLGLMPGMPNPAIFTVVN